MAVTTEHLTIRVSIDWIEEHNLYLTDRTHYYGNPEEYSLIVGDWNRFKEKIVPTDEIWEFSTVTTLMGFTSGEEGYALVRGGEVIAQFTTAIVG